MANELSGDSLVIGLITYTFDSNLGAYVSNDSDYYINQADGDIFTYNYDNPSNGYDFTLYVTNYFDTGDAPASSSGGRGFLGDLLDSVSKAATNQDFINGVLGKVTGIPTSGGQKPPGSPKTGNQGNSKQGGKTSHTTLYIVLGVLIAGSIITYVVLKNKKK